MSYGNFTSWLASYNRETGALSTYAAKECGYGEGLRAGYVINRGTAEVPDLFITPLGRDVVAICKTLEHLAADRNAAKQKVLDWMGAEGRLGNLRQNSQAPAWPEYEAAQRAFDEAAAAIT